MAFWNKRIEPEATGQAVTSTELELATQAPAVSERSIDPAILPYLRGFVTPTSSGSFVSDYTAQGLPGLSRAFRIRSEHLAALPLVARNTLTNEALEDQSFLLTRPNPTLTRFDFFYQVSSSLQWSGNSVIICEGADDQGLPTVLTVADPRQVEVYKYQGDLYWSVAGVPYPSEQILHIKGDYLKDSRCILAPSPIQRYAETIGEIQAQRLAGNRYWKDGGSVPPVIISLLEDTNGGGEGHAAERAREVAAFWNASSGASSKQARVLPPNTKVETMTFAEEASAYIEGRNLTIQDVANIAHLESYWLGAPGNPGEYSNISTRLDHLYRVDLLGDMRRIEEAFSTLLPRGTNCKLDTTEMLRSSPQEQALTDQINLTSGAITQDSIRARDGLSPLTLPELPLEEKRMWLIQAVQAGADSEAMCEALDLPHIPFPNLSVQIQPPTKPEPAAPEVTDEQAA